MVTKYTSQIESGEGKVHRFEDWGRLQLAYNINKVHKAHYIMLNIECNQSVINELQEVFRFNDAIIRHLVMHVDGPTKDIPDLGDLAIHIINFHSKPPSVLLIIF